MAPVPKAPKAPKAPRGMITVYIRATPLFASPDAVPALGLQEIRLGPGSGSVYVFPAQKQHFARVAKEHPTGMGFLDYVAAGAGVGLGVGFGDAVGTAAGDALVDLFGGHALKAASREKLEKGVVRERQAL